MPNLRLCRVEGSGFGGLIWSLMGKIDRNLGSRYFVNFGALNWRTGTSETKSITILDVATLEMKEDPQSSTNYPLKDYWRKNCK